MSKVELIFECKHINKVWGREKFMAITPIEVITMAPKSQEASIQRSTETQRPLHEQIQLSDRMQAETIHKDRQTIPTKETENKQYRYDAKEKGNNGFLYSKDRKKKGKNSKKEADDKKQGSTTEFDIRI